MEEHTMTTATDRAGELLTRAALSNDDLGYPNGVEFLGTDVEDWRGILWDNLREGQPTVLVDEDANEMLVAPTRRAFGLRLLDRVQGKRTVRVGWRSNSHHYDIPARLDRETISRFDGPSRALVATA
jgi:hypothetical protein